MFRLIGLSVFTVGLAVTLNVVSCTHSKKNSAGSSAPVLKLEVVQDLNLKKPLELGRGSFVSAASGIIKVNDQFFVVSDDESYLFSFKKNKSSIEAHRLLNDNLAADPKARRSQKADFESLVHLAPEQWPPYGAVVAWPSGSGVKRMRAVTLPLTVGGGFGEPLISDILPLAYRLQKEIRELNIEGVLVRGDKVFLFQRGDAGKGKNALIEMPFASWIKGLKTSEWSGRISSQKIKIGQLNGVNLTFSDATWTKYGLLALASAEDTVSSFADGVVHGSALVRLVGDQAEVLARFEPATKLEGLAFEESAAGIDLYMVNDADTAVAPSRLYKVQLNEAFFATP